ncbi:MAG TPA: ABC transporter ATP-binding protein [Chloroflexia bacterium]
MAHNLTIAAPARPQVPLQQQRALLARYLKPQRGKVALLAVLLFANIGLQLARPLIVRTFIDVALAQGPLDSLFNAGLLFLAVALVNQGVAVAETYVAEDVGWTATNAMRADLVFHCLHLDMGFHNTRTPGELIERIDGDVTALANFFSRFVLLVAGNAVLLAGVLVMLAREDWRVGAVMTLVALGALWVLARSRNIGVAATTEERQASAKLFGFLEERLAGLDDLRANGGSAHTMRRYYEYMRDFFYKWRHAWMLRAIIILIAVALFVAIFILVLSLGAALYQAGAVSLGTVYLFSAYVGMLQRPLNQITEQMQDLQKASASMLRVEELYHIERQIQDGPGAGLPHGPLAVEFAGVTFGYGDETAIIDGVSFRLAPGEVLGLLGRTGSGKTTLTRLLLRLYDPAAGIVRLGGRDVRDLPVEALRRAIGVVTQDVQLFRATVRDNLTLFDATIPDEHIVAVLRDLGLGAWFDALPAGLDTELEAGGRSLSAGEAQLLAFTRVFLRDPGLVILDEASSRLDRATEQLIERAVDKLLAGRTGIIIAHRLGTVERADRILILDDGQVAEQGERARLAHDPGSRFHHLLRTGLEEVLA